MGMFKKAADQVAFWSEPAGSPDFGKSREEWQAAKDGGKSAKGAKDGDCDYHDQVRRDGNR